MIEPFDLTGKALDDEVKFIEQWNWWAVLNTSPLDRITSS